MSDQEHLGSLEQLALLAVWRLEDGAYGARIRREIEDRGGRRLSISAIYTTLIRLQKKGYVGSELAAGASERGGRARRYFRITDAGVEALRRTRQRMSRMWEGLDPGHRPASPG